MYSLYCDECEDSNRVSDSLYRSIFNNEFNLSFHQPKSDTCKKCDVFSIQQNLPGDHQQITEKLNVHIDESEKTRVQLNADKSRACADGVLVFTSDLQKTKPLPYLLMNEAYYKRQLSVYNCGIHDCGSGIGYFSMWHEAIASRGPSEIASCIWCWLNTMKDNGKLPKALVAYSDACGGQNRNIVMATFWMFALLNMNLELIDHIFMVSGHSFLPCDEDFGVDEKSGTGLFLFRMGRYCQESNTLCPEKSGPPKLIAITTANLYRFNLNFTHLGVPI
jgi:hypothetical protein